MDNKKIIKIHNKSDKPDNIVFRDNVLIEKCIKVENKLPKFMKSDGFLNFLFILIIVLGIIYGFNIILTILNPYILFIISKYGI